MNRPHPVVLISLDGWGIAPPSKGNAVTLANTPNMRKFELMYPSTRLMAAGDVVGLPHGEAGNSEVGHLNMGAGRIVYQDILRINAAIADGSFLRNGAFLQAIEHTKKHKSKLHLMGLVGSGSVHSFLEHFYALLWLAKENNVIPSDVILHLFTDGRDAPPQEAITKVAEIEARTVKLGIGRIGSISGRYFAMDRDSNWDRIERAYNCLMLGEGVFATSATLAIENAYAQNITDEFIPPTCILDTTGVPVGLINDNDAIIFFNFRPDRARQLTKALVIPEFEYVKIRRYVGGNEHETGRFEEATMQTFVRKKVPQNLCFISMTEYEKNLPVSAVAFPTEELKMVLARVLSERNLKQLHIGETEKYAHVTYFFNGYREAPFMGEDRIEIPSPKVATYDLQPEMSSFGISDTVIKKLEENSYDFYMINFAAPDMVGHTGNLEAAIKACEAVDNCVGQIAHKTLSLGGACIITADHGNVEVMIDVTSGAVDTNHTVNPVPFLCLYRPFETIANKTLQMGILADVAPSILSLMDIPKPFDMTGRSLLTSIM